MLNDKLQANIDKNFTQEVEAIRDQDPGQLDQVHTTQEVMVMHLQDKKHILRIKITQILRLQGAHSISLITTTLTTTMVQTSQQFQVTKERFQPFMIKISKKKKFR